MEYVLTFLEGIASFVSPCMLPMLPIYLAYFTGNNKEKSDKALMNSIGFVLGFTLVFVIFGVISGVAGSVLGNVIKYAKIVFGVLIIILGLNYMEVLKIGFLNRELNVKNNFDNLNFFKSIAFGMLFSISWTPCVGAFLSSALLLIASQGDVIKGIILILIYSLGLGVPFVISAVLIDKLKSTFEFIKKHYNVVKVVSGIVLIVMGLYVIFG